MDLDAARKEVQRRMSAQLPEQEKIKAADFLIENSGALEATRDQVLQIWQKLKSEA
jgi:dephospho-CoA kinase